MFYPDGGQKEGLISNGPHFFLETDGNLSFQISRINPSMSEKIILVIKFNNKRRFGDTLLKNDLIGKAMDILVLVTPLQNTLLIYE